MSDWDDEHDESEERRPAAPASPPRAPGAPGEGVRIIGAEEAAAAVESGHASGRKPEDQPRYGDVPRAPEGPRPTTRFPLPDSVDPSSVVPRQPSSKIRFPQPEQPADEAPGGEERPSGQMPQLPHWTEPPTGEVPRILPVEDEADDDAEAWSGFAANAPRWRDQQSDWDEPDFDDELLADEGEIRLGALDERRADHSDLFSFEEPAEPEEPAPVRIGATASTARVRPVRPQPRSLRRRPADDEEPGVGPVSPASGRDLPVAIGVGAVIGFGALGLAALGPGWLMLLVGAVVTLAAVEVFDVFRRAGFRPAVPLALVATLALLVGAYLKGERAIPLVLALFVVFSFLWYLSGAVRTRPTVNLGITVLGFMWTAFLGSFAALLLRYPDREGVAFFIGTAIAVVANDVGALFAGRRFGASPLAPEISPNKTWEGFVGGALAAVSASVLFLGFLPGMAPWTAASAFVLGLVVSIVGPLGDLCESMVKRDLGLKDMGSLIPGHGGVLDRFDAILFTLPAVYYLVELLDLAG